MKGLLLSAAAVAVIAGPGLALADPNHDQRDEHRAPPARQSVAPQQRQFRPSAPQGVMTQRYVPQAPRANYGAPARTYSQPSYARQSQFGVQRSAPVERQWNQPRVTPGYSQSGQYGRQNVYRGGGVQSQYNGYRGGAVQGQYNRYRGGAVHGQRDWTRNGGGRNEWRDNDDRDGDGWWRGQRGFEDYEGRRDGYWFAPGWGYYQPESQWYGYDWEVGGIVPYELRGYYVSDPYAYDLPPAPYGCEWIYLGDEMVLIDLASGQIVEMGDSY